MLTGLRRICGRQRCSAMCTRISQEKDNARAGSMTDLLGVVEPVTRPPWLCRAKHVSSCSATFVTRRTCTDQTLQLIGFDPDQLVNTLVPSRAVQRPKRVLAQRRDSPPRSETITTQLHRPTRDPQEK